MDEDGIRVPGVAASRTAIRGALTVRAAKGQAGVRPRRGTHVRPLAGWSMLDIDVLRWRFEDPAELAAA